MNNRLLKNFSILAFSEVAVKAIGFVTLVYLSRTIGVEGFGKINFAQAVVSYFLLFCNLGFDTYGIREVAKREFEGSLLVNHIFTIQLVLAFLSYGVLLLFILIMPKPQEIKLLTTAFGMNLVVFALTIDWFFIGSQQMYPVAGAKIVRSILNASWIILLIRGADDITYFAFIDVASKLALAVFLLMSYRRSGHRLVLVFDRNVWLRMGRDALPMGITLIMAMVYYNLDTVVLGFLKGEKAVGWYSAAYRVVDTLIIIPGLLVRTIFPLLSRTSADPEKTAANSINFVRLMFNVGIPIGFGGLLFAAPCISFIYGDEYANAVVPLQILCWNVAFIFMNTSFNRILLALNKNTDVMKGVFWGAILNILLILLLIPGYGITGASVATACTEFFVLVYSYIRVRNVLVVDLAEVLRRPMAVSCGVFIVTALVGNGGLVPASLSVPLHLVPVYLMLYSSIMHLLRETKYSFV